MSDQTLVERLRFGNSTGDDHDEAADEIERLRSRLAEATDLLARAEDDLGEWERVYETNPDTTRLRLEIMGFRAAAGER